MTYMTGHCSTVWSLYSRMWWLISKNKFTVLIEKSMVCKFLCLCVSDKKLIQLFKRNKVCHMCNCPFCCWEMHRQQNNSHCNKQYRWLASYGGKVFGPAYSLLTLCPQSYLPCSTAHFLLVCAERGSEPASEQGYNLILWWTSDKHVIS